MNELGEFPGPGPDEQDVPTDAQQFTAEEQFSLAMTLMGDALLAVSDAGVRLVEENRRLAAELAAEKAGHPHGIPKDGPGGGE